MKNIILMGASRAGKSTLTQLLRERFNNIMVIETDLFKVAFRKTFYKDKHVSVAEVKDNPDYIDMVLNYYYFANLYKTNSIKLIDTVDFEPKDYALFENSIIICLGYANATKEEIVKSWQKYDTEQDWTKHKPVEELLNYADNEIENSKYLKSECEKYNIKYVDTFSNREEILNDLVNYIEEMIK